MGNGFSTLLGLAVFGYFGYVIYLIISMIFGSTALGDVYVHFIIVCVLIALMILGHFSEDEENGEEISTLDQKDKQKEVNKINEPLENNPFENEDLTLTIIASEKTCEQIERMLKNHNDIIDIYLDSGFWYSNGETGPEWFTVHLIVSPSKKETVEKLIANSPFPINNMHWG